MRNTFINWLCKKAEIDKRVVLLTADLGYSVVEPFSQKFPERFINVGVAEQNMIGISAGLATEGMRPYNYSIGLFPTFRCAEQLRNDIDYHNLPVVNCTVGSGVAYGNLGYSHHAIQDLALMRSMPNMVIATPADCIEVENILDWQFNESKPTYLRMHKSGEPILNVEKDINLSIRFNKIYQPKNIIKERLLDKCVLVQGYLAAKILEIVNNINFEYPVYSLPLWGQPFKNEIISEISRYREIITVEDHLLEGGLGSYLMEIVFLNNLNCKIIPVVIPTEIVGKVARENTLINPLINSFKNAAKDF